MPQVSVIIPTYNHRDYVLQTLEFVFAQTFDDFEIIVVNDGSPDDTADLLRPLAAAGKIRYFEQANVGQSGARNRGLAEARGEFIAMLDDDDIWPTDKLEWQVRFLREHPDVGAVAGDRFWWDGIATPQPPLFERSPRSLTFDSLFNGNPIASPGQVLIRTTVIKELGGLDARIWGADDYDLWFRICKITRFEVLDRIALLYRAHESNASRNFDRMLTNTQTVIRTYAKQASRADAPRLRRVANRWLYDYVGQRIVDRFRAEVSDLQIDTAFRSLRVLRSFITQGISDPVLLKRMLRDMFPLRRMALRSLPAPLVRQIQGVKSHLRRQTGAGVTADGEQVSLPRPHVNNNAVGLAQRSPRLAPSRPLLSVVIPAYNAQRYLEDAVESVLAQTFEDFECLVIDDGSSDRTPSILRDFAVADGRVRPIRIGHAGIVQALNVGVRAARGKLIARMDADDLCYPDRFDRQLRFLDENPRCIAVGSAVMLVDPFNSTLWKIDVKTQHADIDADLLTGNGWALFHPTAILSRQAILDVGGYRAEYQWAEDLDLFLRLAEVGRLANLPDALLRYRQHFASVNRTKLEAQQLRSERVVLEAYHRRGVRAPERLSLPVRPPLTAYDQTRAWCQRALLSRNLYAARRHAMTAFRLQPTAQQSWSLMYHAMLGR
jgi:glycosyltransferase involved in cell wall biosynthesis